jgi:hypothetical protein
MGTLRHLPGKGVLEDWADDSLPPAAFHLLLEIQRNSKPAGGDH